MRSAVQRVAPAPSKDVFILKGASGLGDAIYLRVIAAHLLLSLDRPMEVLTNYPGVFADMPVRTSPNDKKRAYDLRASYGQGKKNPDTNQWQDVCKKAKVPADLPFIVKRDRRETKLTRSVYEQAAGRPIVLVHAGRTPMGELLPPEFMRHQMELLPREQAVAAVVEQIGKECMTVLIGSARRHYEVECELDLWGATTVEDLLDLGQLCDSAVGQCSWIIPLAEVFSKPVLAIWSSRARRSTHPFINTITPRKVLCKETSMSVMDDLTERTTKERVSEFLEL